MPVQMKVKLQISLCYASAAKGAGAAPGGLMFLGGPSVRSYTLDLVNAIPKEPLDRF